MSSETEERVLSRIEFVLPIIMIRTAHDLGRGVGATFLSTNLSKMTATRIKLFKKMDDSVCISCTVTSLSMSEMHQPEHVRIDDVQTNLTRQDDEGLPQVVDLHMDASPLPTANEPLISSHDEVIVQHSFCSRTDMISNFGNTTDLTKSLLNPPGNDFQVPEAEFESVLQTVDAEELPEEIITLQESKSSTPIKLESEIVITQCTMIPGTISVAIPTKDFSGDFKDVQITNHENICISESPRSPNLFKNNRCFSIDLDHDTQTIDLQNLKKIKNKSKMVQPARRSSRKSQLPERYKMGTNKNDMKHTENTKYVYEECPDVSQESQKQPIKKSPITTKQSATLQKINVDVKNKLQADETRPPDISKNLDAENKTTKKIPETAIVNYDVICKENTKKVKCPLCGSLHKKTEALFDHVKTKHSQVPEYESVLTKLKQQIKCQCEMCGKEFSRSGSVKMHIENMHAEHSTVQCPKCERVFKSERHLNLHVKRCHQVTKRAFLCHLCPASFKVKAYLVTHLQNVHIDVTSQRHSCNICQKTFNTERYMKTHRMRVHGTKKYVCAYCDKAFGEQSNLRRHIALNHDQIKIKPHYCKYCNKSFSLKANLKDHTEVIHLKLKPFQCNKCMQRFNRKKQLIQHKEQSAKFGVCISKQKQIPNRESKKLDADSQLQENILVTKTNIGTINSIAKDIDPDNVQYIIATPEIMEAFGIETIS